MSDETTSTGGWSSADAAGSATPNPAPGPPTGTAERVGFCQDCGKPLTAETVRPVGTGVFCEPCLTARVGAPAAAPGYTAPGYTTVPTYLGTVPQAIVSGEPSPVLAGLLGFIPGVGAMYNGQFAKGIVHVVIFAILVSLADNHDIFGFFVAGWEFYMAFEAYHTAKARRDGLPLPNAFGFNDIGERMGFGKSWGTVGSVNYAGPTAPPAPGTPAATSTPPGYATVSNAAPAYVPPSYVPPSYVPVGTAPDWVGYVPPPAFGSAAAQQEAAAAQARDYAAQNAAYYSQSPYTQPYAEPGFVPSMTANAPTTVLPLDVPSKRFPVGAFWLIGLGVLILLANLIPDWHLNGRWFPPIVFAGLSAWLFTRRLHSGVNLICIIRWPVILMTLAIMFALHAAYLPVTFGLTVSVLLIVFGALLLLERTAGATAVYAPPVAYSVVPSSTVQAEAETSHSRAAFTTSESDGTESTKDGQ